MAATSNDTRKVLEGCLDDLPSEESNVVRIFLSSTFTDYTAERNTLMHDAVPQLRTYCQKRGLDFQVVDMRWGIRDDAQVDHQTTELCLREVKNCHRMSCGPSFVALLGNKYGYRPFPSKIDASEFKILLDTSKSLGKDTALLEEWFICDDNAVPPTYILQPITSKFPCYSDMSEKNESERKQQQDEWNAVRALLTSTFHTAASTACQKGRISEQQKHKYFQSVTENEVTHAILDVSDCNQRAICFIRELTDIVTTDKLSGRFVDLEGRIEDEEASELLQSLKQNRVPSVLSKENIEEFSVKWTEMGVDINIKEHAEYLLNFTEKFISHIQQLVDSSLTTRNIAANQEQLYKEVLHHSHFTNGKCQHFCGREELLGIIKEKLKETFENEHVKKMFKTAMDDENEKSQDETNKNDANKIKQQQEAIDQHSQHGHMLEQMGVKFAMEDEEVSADDIRTNAIQLSPMSSYNKPIILYGPSGCGKTALMAVLAKMSFDWLEGSPVKIVRFLGTSPLSVSIKETLLGICHQIWVVYEEKPPMELDLGKEFSFLVMYFRALLRKIDTKSKPLVIILDSVDQLISQDYAHSMKWLPTVLPENVYLIVSMLPEQHGCLRNCHHVMEDESRYVEVTPLADQTAKDILNLWGKLVNRTLTTKQMNHVMDKFVQSPQPLFLKLAFQQAVTWKSYTQESKWQLGSTVTEAIHQLFDNLERDHGQVIVSKALGFLTCSKNGLSDPEIEDVLSCDDEVLQDTYLYHLPPDEHTVRLPPLLWRRIHYDLQEYLVERKADEKDIITWYHRQFWEAAGNRYVTEDIKVKLHEGLVDYFSGKWCEVVKPLELFKKKKGSYPNANRQVASQPLVYRKDVYNQRKMSELPYHLVKSGQYAEFVKQICRNFEWLYYKSKAVSLDEVLADLKLALSRMNELKIDTEELAEVKKLLDILVLASDAVRHNVNNLPMQILGQLNKNSDLPEGFAELRHQAREWCDASAKPLLVPNSHCLPTTGSELQTNIEHIMCFMGDEPKHECKLCLSKDGKVLYAVERTKSKNYKDSLRGDLLKVIDLENSGTICEIQQLTGMDVRWLKMTEDGRYLILDIYLERDNYQPVSHMVIFDHHQQEPITFQPREDVVGLSNSGKYALTRKSAPSGPKKENDSTEKQHINVGVIIELETQKRHSLWYQDVKILEALFSMDDHYLVVVIATGYLIWEVCTGKLLHSWINDDKFATFGSSVENKKNPMKLLNNRIFVAPGIGYQKSSNLYMRDIANGELLKEFTEQYYEIDLIAIDHDQRFAATASTSSVFSSRCKDKNIRVFDLKEKKLRSVIATNDIHGILEFAGHYEGFILTSTWKNPAVQVWYIGTKTTPLLNGVLVHQIVGHSEEILFAQVTEDDSTLITASKDNSVKLWDMQILSQKLYKMVADGQNVLNVKRNHPFELGEGPITTTATAVSKDGKTAVVGTKDGWVIFYDLLTMKMKSYVKQGEEVSQALASSSGNHFVTAAGKKLSVWDPNSGTFLWELEGGAVRRMGGSGDGPSCLAESCNILVAGYAGMECYGSIWNLETGEHLKNLQGLYGFNQVVISSDAAKVATTFFEFPMIFSVETGQPLGFDQSKMDTMMNGCTCLRLSNNNELLVSCSTDGSVKVMNMHTGEYKFRMQHRSTVAEAVFSPDSSVLLTAGFKNILVWSMQDGHLLNTLTSHNDFLYRLVFSCDGRFLVSSSADKQILIWKFDEKNTCIVASFQAHCPVRNVTVADDLSSVLYAPTNVAYLGVLKPNSTLERVISGEESLEVSDTLQKAQAFVFAFSSQKVAETTSRSCVIV